MKKFLALLMAVVMIAALCACGAQQTGAAATAAPTAAPESNVKLQILCEQDDSMVVIATGPLTGTGAPSSNRFDISSLSPQTGFMASSNSGGNFGYYLKKAGYDALILTGKCDGHKWLEIENDRFTLHDAEDLWGLKISETQEKLNQKLADDRGCKVKCGMD